MVSSFSIDVTHSMNATANSAKAFSYDATEDRGRRRPALTRVKAEDLHADARKRQMLSATTQDLARNFEVAAWAIRKHLDYVASFNFQPKTKDEGYNAVLAETINRLSAKERFDSANRHPLRRGLRITEACRAKDGDCLWLKLIGGLDRGRIQGIESYRIDMPRGDMPEKQTEQWVNGVRVGSTGAHLDYAICDLDIRGRKKLVRTVPARNAIYHGFSDRWDQVRGISPIAAALNRFRDIYEGLEYTQAKLKVSQLFGLEFYRETDGSTSPFGPASASRDDDGDGAADSGYEVNLSGGGPFVVDMNPGDRVGVIESKTPATEVVNFLKLIIFLALKSLDIPFSFFDESFTNFYGSRGGLIQYLKSCDSKRADLQDLLDAWTKWRLGIAVADGELDLPSGQEFSSIAWEWVPTGVPWWDSVKEARGAAMSIAMGASSPQRECRLSGSDFYQNVRETADALKFAESLNVPLSFADSTAFAPEISVEAAAV